MRYPITRSRRISKSVDEINALELTAKQSAAQICLLMKFSLAWTWLVYHNKYARSL
jgi:hypothetical protein